jgi:hypothetical protein
VLSDGYKNMLPRELGHNTFGGKAGAVSSLADGWTRLPFCATFCSH